MNKEEWREIKGFDGKYLVSNLGRVKSNPSRQEGRILKPGTQSKGYQTVHLYLPVTPKKGVSITVHRIVLETFGPKPTAEQTEINHKDMDKTNNCIDNLEWCTSKQNHKHAVATGGHWSGENSGKAKLSDKQVVEILTKRAAGETNKKLAEMFKVDISYIRDLCKGKGRPKAQKMYQLSKAKMTFADLPDISRKWKIY